jgi:hypothetical protein
MGRWADGQITDGQITGEQITDGQANNRLKLTETGLIFFLQSEI